MPAKIDDTELQIRARWIKAERFIIADYDRFGVKNQSEFATKLGWRSNNLSRTINHPNNAIPQKYLNKIIIVFGLDPDWLMTGRGEMKFHAIQVQVSLKKIIEKAKNPINIGSSMQTKSANKTDKKVIK